ncbi:AraC family transcriptional regulator [Winogradskyella aurantiaca]|uniref:AraC family transcriptional regulator n=1 Tax=Winogradskyella aurantiaca TaxID=2219558 RepID=UPI000E1DCC02|nr:AraC family transcriptional regulator [Winogradskyella aurantiaca]
MKVLPFTIPKPEPSGLIYQEDHEWLFYDQLHQHEELQISYIVKGSGTLIVSEAINAYSEGDVFVIGGNVPHLFKSDLDLPEKSFMQSLFFTQTAFGVDFFHLSETEILQGFFKSSQLGLQVISDLEVLHKLFHQLKSATKLERLIILLQMINAIQQSQFRELASGRIQAQLSLKQGERLRQVFDFTMSYYDSEISLDRVAEVAHMTKTAFCKYFKKRTNKTYYQFLNEYRIEMVVKAMRLHPERSMSQIAYDCGFGSVSNFNKTFKRIKGCTPGQMRA